jgi:hypothetical protein
MIQLLEHRQVDQFHHFIMKGNIDTYYITVIKPPVDFHGEGWGGSPNGGHYIVINNDRNTKRGSCFTYNFVSSYFLDSQPDYLPYRIGIQEKAWEDFMDCSREFIYPAIKKHEK